MKNDKEREMWKTNWKETEQRFNDFWDRKGFILSKWNGYFPVDRSTCPDLPVLEKGMAEIEKNGDWGRFYLDAQLVASQQQRAICHSVYPGDLLPFSYCDWGTVTLAPMLGAEQHFNKDTVWYTHENNPVSPENDRPLILHDDSGWFRDLQELARIGTDWARGKYHCGAPAIFGGLDVLSELRGASELCMDLILEPDWVKAKLQEIDVASKKAYHRLYDIMKDEDGSLFHAFFMVWGKGKTSLVQCDFATLISEDMFREFSVPSILESCSYLDHSLYHVDGPEALRTVDALLEIDALDCIEFTPGPQVPQGGDPRWYPLYRKIKESGKCVQVVEMQAEEVIPLLDAIGTDGVYMMVNFRSEQEIDDLNEAVKKYR
ncbi:MAG TPA: hypothetical protein VJ869_11770 [Sphaerochaeta sp.]|nr:hypothetical protein [Sphaerochaeta sp.]